MPEPIRAMLDEFTSGLALPRYDLAIVKRAWIAGAMSMFHGILTGEITSDMAKEILSELMTCWAKLETEESGTVRH